LAGSFSESADKLVGLQTRFLKAGVSAYTKNIIVVGDDGEVMVLCFFILERKRVRIVICRRWFSIIAAPCVVGVSGYGGITILRKKNNEITGDN
jgi:hypothetical protein